MLLSIKKYAWPLWIVGLIYGFSAALFWMGYHVDFAKFTDKKNRGRQLSAIMATRRVISVFIPLSAGFLVSRFGFDMLFVIAIALYLVSGIPYITIPRTHEKFSWTYLETLKKIFSKKNRRMIMAYMAYGSEEVVGFIIWPIFIFQILDGNYFKVGALSSLIIGATVVFQLVLGKYIDGGRRSKILQMGSILYSLGWIAKIFIATAFQIFIIGSYHNFTRIFLRTPFNALTYEIAADEGHYVDEFTVVKEMAVSLGKTVMAILAIIISLFFAVKWTFIIAAAAVLLFNLLSIKEELMFSKTAD